MFTEKYWLPAGVTWSSLEKYAADAGATVIPKSSDLLLAFPLAIGLTLVRFLFEQTLGVTLCNKLKVAKTKQFSESLWRFFVYLGTSAYGTWGIGARCPTFEIIKY